LLATLRLDQKRGGGGRVKKLEKNIKIKLNIFFPLPPGNDNSVFSSICDSRFNWVHLFIKKEWV
jgi:hypothetical protein